MERKRVELNWPTKKDILDRISSIGNVSLPFQVVETVNETRATREAKKSHGLQKTLYDMWSNGEGETFDSGWKNKLIWGDNKYVLATLLGKYAGKIDLIYIDPPFATGADFSLRISIGNRTLDKEPTAIEQKAYRDTWGRGIESYLDMMYERLYLMRQLLSEKGSIYVHTDWHVGHYVKAIMDEIFGKDNFLNDIVWKRTAAHNDPKRYGVVDDKILFYSKTESWIWNDPIIKYQEWYIDRYYRYKDSNGRKWLSRDLTGAGAQGGQYVWKGKKPARGRHWAVKKETMDELFAQGKIYFTENGIPRQKQYLDEMEGSPAQSIWDDILSIVSWSSEGNDYQTQKPEELLERIIAASSKPDSIVADFFCGSGTTLAVAEKLKRRWVGCDLGRYAIHTTRKRLMEIEACKPFEILNLGKYERQIWQESSFTRGKETILFEYLAFILKLYGAEPIAGFQLIHGRKGKALIHIGSVDAPVTIHEVVSAMDECNQARQSELHVLGWEWEMGIHELLEQEAKLKGIKLRLLTIPNEVMESSAVQKGDIAFFDLAFFKADLKVGKNSVQVELEDFVIPNTELIPDEVRSKISRWSDFVDYWAIDFDFHNDTFMNNWTAYRSKDIPKLVTKSDPYVYQKSGKYRIVVKVIDIFGIDTSQAFEVDI